MATKAARRNRQLERESQRRRNVKDARWPKVVAVAGLVVAAVSLVVSGLMWRSAEKANAVAQQNLALAQAAAADVALPCLRLTEFKFLSGCESDCAYKVGAVVKNACSGIAYRLRSNSRLKLHRTLEEAVAAQARLRYMKAEDTLLIPPGEVSSIYRVRDVSKAEREAMRSRELFLVMYGKIWYSEATGREREQRFCSFYEPYLGNWLVCNGGGNTLR